ncbi:hypothetical protein [Mameliella sp.]|uniref:hypothetical protein n=1 Tax=Mameliella sp. TaxID=1924940 RepID=UPI003B5017D4
MPAFRPFACAVLTAALPCFGWTDTARAAEITILDDHPEACNAMLSGQITEGDTDRLRRVIPPAKSAFDRAHIATWLCLDSPGGSFPEGLDLAAYIRETGISTHVAADDSCLSACALAFLGGTQFWIEDGLTRSRSRSMHAAATLGFHAPQLNVPSGQFSETVVAQAFDVAIRASAEIFGGLEELRISRDFALSFFDVSGQEFYQIDTPDRVRELGVTITGLGPLPDRIDEARIRDLCTTAYPSMDPARYADPIAPTSFAGNWVMTQPASQRGGLVTAYLSATTAEGTLMMEACRVTRDLGRPIVLEHFRDIRTNRGTWDSPQPPTPLHLARQLGELPRTGYTRVTAALSAPIGTRLADLQSRRPGVTDARVTQATCAPIAQSYRVVRVQNFSNMRAEPGFGAAVIMEVGKDREVIPIDRSLNGAAILSDACRVACRPSDHGVLTAEAMHGIQACLSSSDLWWQVRTASGTQGWMSSRFLSP